MEGALSLCSGYERETVGGALLLRVGKDGRLRVGRVCVTMMLVVS